MGRETQRRLALLGDRRRGRGRLESRQLQGTTVMHTGRERGLPSPPVGVNGGVARVAACPFPRALRSAFERAARDASIPPAMLYAVAKVESNLRAGRRVAPPVRAASAADAGNGGRRSTLNVDEPGSNVLAGARYLRQLLDRFGSSDLALAAYNAGPTAVTLAGGAPSVDVQRYVANVNRAVALGRRLPLAAVAGARAGGLRRRVEAVGAADDHGRDHRRERLRHGGDAAGPGEGRSRSRPRALDPAKTYDVKLRDELRQLHDPARRQDVSPATTASFVSLVQKGYFDQTIFHRIVPGFVIQGGDPTATGTGGPGYTTVDTPPASTRYTLGARGDGEGRQRSLQARPAASSSSSRRRTRSCRRTTPCSARSCKGSPVVQAIGKLGDPSSGGAGRRPRPSRSRRRRSTSTRAAAVVLAAGASTRYGGVKQRELLPAVLEALATDERRRGRRRRGRACARGARRPRRPLRRLGAAGPAPRFAAGSRRSARASSGR